MTMAEKKPLTKEEYGKLSGDIAERVALAIKNEMGRDLITKITNKDGFYSQKIWIRNLDDDAFASFLDDVKKMEVKIHVTYKGTKRFNQITVSDFEAVKLFQGIDKALQEIEQNKQPEPQGKLTLEEYMAFSEDDTQKRIALALERIMGKEEMKHIAINGEFTASFSHENGNLQKKNFTNNLGDGVLHQLWTDLTRADLNGLIGISQDNGGNIEMCIGDKESSIDIFRSFCRDCTQAHESNAWRENDAVRMGNALAGYAANLSGAIQTVMGAGKNPPQAKHLFDDLMSQLSEQGMAHYIQYESNPVANVERTIVEPPQGSGFKPRDYYDFAPPIDMFEDRIAPANVQSQTCRDIIVSSKRLVSLIASVRKFPNANGFVDKLKDAASDLRVKLELEKESFQPSLLTHTKVVAHDEVSELDREITSVLSWLDKVIPMLTDEAIQKEVDEFRAKHSEKTSFSSPG